MLAGVSVSPEPPCDDPSEVHISTLNPLLISFNTIPYRQDYCHVCCDGSEELVLCDLCTRVLCRKHLEGLPPQFDISQYDFVCMACHEEKLGKILYHVSPLACSPGP